MTKPKAAVALRKESVDRNVMSAIPPAAFQQVALRKESVDRNAFAAWPGTRACASLSARRAWIEILYRQGFGYPVEVALRKESVDRNFVAQNIIQAVFGRSPQGERG